MNVPFRPSQAARAIACPGSVKHTKSEEKPSKYAAEGTLAHEVAELAVRNKGQLPANPSWSEDMVLGARAYWDAIYGVMQGSLPTLGPLTEFKVPWGSFRMKGGTIDALLVVDGALWIFDYKFGAGVPVSPVENAQMLSYAVGLAPFFKFWNVKTVMFGIIQPRIYDEMLTWDATNAVVPFREALEAAAISSEYKAGGHCRWCPMAGNCKTQRKEIETVFGIELDDGVQSTYLPPPEMLTAQDLAKYMDVGDLLSNWLFAVRERAHELAVQGHTIPGYSLKQKMKNRAWLDEGAVVKALLTDLGDRMYSKTLLSPAQVEKLLPKDRRAMVNDLCARELGAFYLAKTTGSTYNNADIKAFKPISQ